MTRLAIGVSLVLFAGLALAHSHGQENERFAAAGLTNGEVETFYKDFREAISAGDKKKVASLVSFPVGVMLSSGAKRTIRNKADFVKSYDQIFDDEFRQLIAKTEVTALWARWTGVAMPRGEIWFAGVGKTKPAVIKIITINGPIRSQSVDTKPSQSVTLHNRRGTPNSDNWKESIVSFRHERLYFAELGPHNEWDLLYGDLDYKGDRDWLKVNCERNTWSRIRDLGELDWSDDIQVPVLPTLPCGTNVPCGRIQIPPSQSGKKIEDEDLNPHIAKPKVGHMYVVHRYRERRRNDRPVFQTLSDYYTLIRVEDLKPNESCTITWKRVPTPK